MILGWKCWAEFIEQILEFKDHIESVDVVISHHDEEIDRFLDLLKLFNYSQRIPKKIENEIFDYFNYKNQKDRNLFY